MGKQLDAAFEQAKGDIFKTVREAQTHAYDKVTLAEATELQFAGQLKAFLAAPRIYTHEQKLRMLEEALAKIRKYVVVADKDDSQVTVVDLQDKLSPDLYEMGVVKENNQP